MALGISRRPVMPSIPSGAADGAPMTVALMRHGSMWDGARKVSMPESKFLAGSTTALSGAKRTRRLRRRAKPHAKWKADGRKKSRTARNSTGHWTRGDSRPKHCLGETYEIHL